MTLDDLLNRLDNVKQEGNSYLARCPSHADDRPSLLVTLEASGRLLLYCRAGCKTHAVVEALGMRMGDLFNVQAGGANTATVGAKEAPSAEHLADAAAYCEEANLRYPGSPAAKYAEDRFGMTESLGYFLGLGFNDGTIDCAWTTAAYTRVPRLVVPFAGFDGVVRGWQSRALEADEAPWCGPKNPPGHSWSTIGVFDLDNDERNVLITEGPGDRLTAVAAGYSAVAIRGAALARNTDTLDQLVENLVGRRVVLCGDNDDAGLDFNLTLGAHLAAAGHQVHTLEIPTGSDLSDWRAASPTQFVIDLRRAIRSATRIDANSMPAPPELPDDDDDFVLDFDLVDDLPRTDEGNAMRIMSLAQGLLRWNPEMGFLIYDDGRWERDRHRQVDNLMAAVCAFMVATGIQMTARGEDTDDDDLIRRGDSLTAWGRSSQNSPRFGNAPKHAQPKVALDFEMLDRHDHLLVVGNGTVDLRSGELGDHDPDLFITHRIEADYDPEAAAPRWTQFLLEVFEGNTDLIDYVQRLIGYGVTGSTREQCFAVLHGTGSNGKSVLLGVLNEVLNDIVGVAAFSAFEAKPTGGSTADLAALRGARLVFAQEGERNKPMAEAVIKRATGGDRITARHLYRDQMTYLPKFLLLLSSNYKPRFGGQDEGLWRRVKLIPFKRTFAPEERDVYLTETLLAEAEGILAWVIEGAVEWYRTGLADPPIIKEAAADYKSTSDDLAGFCDFVVLAKKGARIKGSVLYEAYRDWATTEGVHPWSARAVNEAVVERMEGVIKVKRMDGVWLDNLRLATPEDRGDDE